MSDDTGVLKMSPVNSHVVCLASIPDVPSKTCERKLDVLKHKGQSYMFGMNYKCNIKGTRMSRHQLKG